MGIKLLRLIYVIAFIAGVVYSTYLLTDNGALRTWPILCLGIIFILVYNRLPKKIWPMAQLLIIPLWPVLWHRDLRAIIAFSVMGYITMVFAYVIYIINELKRDKTNLFWKILGHSVFLLVSMGTAGWFLHNSMSLELSLANIIYSLAFLGSVIYNTILIYKNYFSYE